MTITRTLGNLYWLEADELLQRAYEWGLSVRVDGDRLVIRGPKDAAAPIGQALLDRKPEILAILQPDHALAYREDPDSSWDLAEANVRLAEVLGDLDRLEQQHAKSDAHRRVIDSYRKVFRRYHAGHDQALFQPVDHWAAIFSSWSEDAKQTEKGETK